MSEDRTLVPNVLAFIDKAAALHGKVCEEKFSTDMFRYLTYGACHSPIEDMFFVAVRAICAAEDVEINPDPGWVGSGKMQAGKGLFVRTQAEVGKYRVDFLLTQNRLAPDTSCPPIVVELDGHDFHDKDKNQRRYEKARDRFLAKERLVVLHFTGSEVVADPFKVAHEVLSMLGVFSYEKEYDAANPLGFEV